jgi:hypothetical protein
VEVSRGVAPHRLAAVWSKVTAHGHLPPATPVSIEQKTTDMDGSWCDSELVCMCACIRVSHSPIVLQIHKADLALDAAPPDPLPTPHLMPTSRLLGLSPS